MDFFKQFTLLRSLEAEAERRQILLLCSKLGDMCRERQLSYASDKRLR